MPPELNAQVTLKKLPAAILEIDASYQRDQDPQKIRKIADEFDAHLFEPLEVNIRADGHHYVINGGHRLAAIHRMGYSDQLLECLIHEGWTQEEEAKKFASQSRNTTRLTVLQEFKADLLRGDPEARKISTLLSQFGLHVTAPPKTNSPNSIDAVRSLQKIYRQSGGEGLLWIIRILKDAYGYQHAAYQQKILDGMHSFYQRYGQEANPVRVVQVLQSLGIQGWIRRSAQIGEAISGAKGAQATARAVYEAYNKGMKKNFLRSWDEGRRR